MDNRPQARGGKVNTQKSAGIKRHGEGLGKGPVGNQTAEFMKEHYQKQASEKNGEDEKPRQNTAPPNRGPAQNSAPENDHSQTAPGRGLIGGVSGGSSSGSGGGGKKSLLSIIAIIIVVIIVIVLLRSCMCGGTSSGTFGSGGTGSFATTPTASTANTDTYSLAGLLGDYDYDGYYDNYNYSSYNGNSYDYSDYYGSGGYDISSLLGSLGYGGTSGGGHVSAGSWDANTGVLNTAVAAGSPAKLTQINGNGNDTVTVMVYICGADLESSGGAATMDIQEMLNASASDNVNIVLYTGGTRQWQNNVMSASTNQIYQISNGSLYRLESNMGSKPLTDPNTLTEFIQYCATNFPANRNMLVLWDHGGGSVSGYAYDENYKSNGYMSLAGINKALNNANVYFDIIGFDTCLMATVENALMLSNYADYLVASEEVEPGNGWYYTDWMSALAKNPSISSLELGKTIVDSFISTSASSAYGIGCTLSLTDLKELSYTVPDKLEAFADDISAMTDSASSAGDYTAIINARTNTREFGETQSLDQIDLVNFANNIGTDSAFALVEAIKSAVKYNNVSSGMSYAYGLSVFFPYNCISYVSKAASIYDEIGLTAAYTTCIKKVANITGNGQSIYGGSSYAYSSLFDALQGGNAYSGDHYSSGDITGLFSDMFFGRTLKESDPEIRYLAENRFDASKLKWTQNAEGVPVIALEEDQWALVKDVTLNIFYDDGEGYIDLGADNNFFSYDDDGNLYCDYQNSWLSIDGQIVAYYFDSMTVNDDFFSVTGHVPVLFNGERADLIIIFDSSAPDGYIAGVSHEYQNEDTGMMAKVKTNLKEGDEIFFTADYYTYEGEYQDSYIISDAWSYRHGAEIEEILVEGDIYALFDFIDVYNNHYWSPQIQTVGK